MIHSVKNVRKNITTPSNNFVCDFQKKRNKKGFFFLMSAIEKTDNLDGSNLQLGFRRKK